MHIILREDAYNPDKTYSTFLRQQAYDPDWLAWLEIISSLVQKDDCIAEYGAGFGNIAIPIALEGYHYTAYDLNSDAVTHMQSLHWEKLHPRWPMN